MRLLIAFVFTAALSVYLGGALVMELVWRPAQRAVPPAQVGVVCQRMGRRWRWVASGTLGLVAAAWIFWPRSPAPDWAAPLSVLCWGSLAALVLTMGVLLHPRSHARGRAAADGAAHAAARRRRLRAMRAMDVLLRMELAVAVAAAVLAALPGAPGAGGGR